MDNQNFSLMLIIALSFMFHGCCSDESIESNSIDTSFVEKTIDGRYKYSIQISTTLEDFDIDNGDMLTRASDNGKWEDGDIIYFAFFYQSPSGPNHDKNLGQGVAKYDIITNTWSLTTENAIKSANYCWAEHFVGSGAAVIESDKITYNYFSGYYGSYGDLKKSNGIFVLNTFEPHYNRLRFKGNPGMQFLVHSQENKFRIYNSWQPHDYILGYINQAEITVNENGYTDYILYERISGFSKLFVSYDGKTFWHGLPSLDEGKSGCLSVPSLDNLHGWSLVE